MRPTSSAAVAGRPGTGSIDYLLGLGKTSAGFMLLLDLDRVLSGAEAAIVSV